MKMTKKGKPKGRASRKLLQLEAVKAVKSNMVGEGTENLIPAMTHGCH